MLVPVVEREVDEGASPLAGVSNVTEIDGSPAIDETMPTLEFGTDGILSGDANQPLVIESASGSTMSARRRLRSLSRRSAHAHGK